MKKITGLQWAGLVTIILGVCMALFPSVVGITAIYILCIGIVAMGVYALVGSLKRSSIFLSVLSVGIILAGLYVLRKPQVILLFIGGLCLIIGLSTLLHQFNRKGKFSRYIYPVIITLLGLYTTMNASAAGTALIFTLGIVLMGLGGYMIYKKTLFTNIDINFSNASNPFRQQNTDDDIIDVEFREKDEE